MSSTPRFQWADGVETRGVDRLVIRFALFGLAAVAAFWLGFVAFDAKAAGEWVQHGGYAITAVVFGWWVAAGVREFSREGPSMRWWRGREALQVSILVAALLVVAVLTAPYDYKILYDEPVIQTTAWNLHLEREVGAVGRAYVINGQLEPLTVYLDKRPIFFPFLVSLIHDLTGYREANAFALNTALFPVILGLVYALGRRFGGHGPGLAATAALGAFSLLAINATGAGMELLNLALILGLALAGARYLEHPDERSISFLVLTAILLAFTRYESALYVGSAAVLVLAGWWRARRPVLSWAAIIAPLLLVPTALQNTYLSGTPVLWELRDGYDARFSLHYLWANLAFAKTYFFATGGMIANSLWLSVAGGGAALYCFFGATRSLWRRESLRPVSVAVACCAAGAVGNLGLLMAYYWGDLSDPVASRLSLPIQAALALAIAAALARTPETWRPRAVRFAVAGALLVYLGLHLPVNQRLSELNTINTAFEWETKVLKERGPAERLVVSDKSSLWWFMRGVSSTSLGRLGARPEGVSFHVGAQSFDEIIVTQTLRPTDAEGDFVVQPEDALPARFVLEPLAERRIGARLQRISLLREIKMDEPSSGMVSSPAAR